eukprot:RCo037338
MMGLEAADQYKLTANEFDRCSQAFNDVAQHGKIDSPWMMKSLMQTLGMNPSEKDITDAFSKFGKGREKDARTLEYSDFIALMEQEKKKQAAPPAPDADLVEAFMSLGGDEDRSGEVAVEDLKRIMTDFGLDLNVDEFVEATLGDSASDGMLNFTEFSRIFRRIFDMPEPPKPPAAAPEAESRTAREELVARMTARRRGSAQGMPSVRAPMATNRPAKK